MTPLEPMPNAVALVATRASPAEAIASRRENRACFEARMRKAGIENRPAAASCGNQEKRGPVGQKAKARQTGGRVKSEALWLRKVQGENQKIECKQQRLGAIAHWVNGNIHGIRGDGDDDNADLTYPPAPHHRSD